MWINSTSCVKSNYLSSKASSLSGYLPTPAQPRPGVDVRTNLTPIEQSLLPRFGSSRGYSRFRYNPSSPYGYMLPRIPIRSKGAGIAQQANGAQSPAQQLISSPTAGQNRSKSSAIDNLSPREQEIIRYLSGNDG